MIIYIHTVDGKPGFFSDCQICYAADNHGSATRNTPALSLAQIRKEQAASRRFRKAAGWDIPEYGYRRYAVPDKRSEDERFRRAIQRSVGRGH